MSYFKEYRVVGGDGGAYGEYFGPVYGKEANDIQISGTKTKGFLILRLTSSLMIGNDEIEYIIISPRYQDDDVNKIRMKECVVGISIVKGKVDKSKMIINKKSIKYYAIGKSSPW